MKWIKDALTRIGRLFHRHEWRPASREHWVCYKCGERVSLKIPPKPHSKFAKNGLDH